MLLIPNQLTKKKRQLKKNRGNCTTTGKKDVYVPNPQLPDDINLNQIGQNVSDAKGELTLKAYKKVNETLNVGPIEVKVKEMKVMHATRITA